MTDVRADIPAKYKWDLSAIYPDMAAFDADYAKAQKLIEAFPSHQETMCKSPEGLYAMFSDSLELGRLLEKMYEYAMLNSDVDTSDNTYLALRGRVMNLDEALSAATFFVDPNLLRLEEDTLNEWYESFPKLQEFRRSITLSRRFRPHMLSDECEKLLANLQGALHSHDHIRSVFANADLLFGKIKGEDGKELQLTDTNYVPLLMSTDRRVRRAAFSKLYETYSNYGNTFASLLSGFVKERVTLARVRNFENSLEASVFHDEVTPVIYNNLIGTVEKNLKPLFDYYALKKKALGVPQLHLYDIYTPLITSCDRKYSYEEAVDIVLDAVKIFGEEYHSTLENGLKHLGWADVYPNKGKRGGAYSAGSYDTQPYILLNYTDTLDDVSTLAHEAGHSMHSWFSAQANTPQESRYTIFVAEVASTVNELILFHKLLRETDSDEEKLYILNQLMETYKGTLYRQTMFASFEKEIHALCEAGETLTKDLLSQRYYKLVKRYFGKDVVCDKQIAYEWMRIPHFYYNFYVYKYATCISAASSIVKKIETQGDAYVQKYLDFLKCGGSRSPLESLQVADIDLTKPEVIEDAIADFAATVEQFRELYNKLNP
ncbi:MAG: oligoendopeptidase F [Oscillospiraceae bacterium]|nr:oligoendopeptidase F [Oscillospiraceae bacterium]